MFVLSKSDKSSHLRIQCKKNSKNDILTIHVKFVCKAVGERIRHANVHKMSAKLVSEFLFFIFYFFYLKTIFL